jgi:vacuolar protein sorting-associated protein 13A/C
LKESGMMAAMVTKIIDNLQVSITNVHVRVESTDIARISTGLTLQAIELCTTDNNWSKQFVDRAKEQNATLFKLLSIKQFGVYHKTEETCLLCELPAESIKSEMQALTSFDQATGKLSTYTHDYLVEPIIQEIRLTQNELVSALDNKWPHYVLDIALPHFAICLRKT